MAGGACFPMIRCYNLMRCSLKEPVFVSGQVNEVKIIVEDRVGNKNELLVKVKK